MPSQGWAGGKPPTDTLKCAVCLVRDKASRDAVTQIGGTLLCLEHAMWIPVPVTPPMARTNMILHPDDE